MEYYFRYNEAYDRTLMRRILLQDGFNEEFRKIFEMEIPTYVKGQIKVNLTSPSEGRIQVQSYSESPEKDMRDLKLKLKPNKVVDSGCREIWL